MPDYRELLQKFWGYTEFRGSQRHIIERLQEGEDVIALMPTGGGKSLCYQLPALAFEGIAIVVSPLVALMEDQLGGLRQRGVKAMGIYGPLKESELIQKLDNADFGSYKLLYLSPERLRQELVLERLSRLNVSLIAIDEAHCISQWGFDFRPAYLECSRLKSLHPDSPLIALTATATPAVLEDIRTLLEVPEARVFKDSVRRENLAYRVLETEDKYYRLKQVCQKVKGSSIVYVRSRRSSKMVSDYLNEQGIPAKFFHGGLSADEKKSRMDYWRKQPGPLMVATNAFGMGVDKPNVRLVVHFDPPETIEHYFQEAGRAGRDGDHAQALLLLGPSDIQDSQRYFLGSLPDTEDLITVYRKINSHFGIAYGERPESLFNFRFETFCETYGLPARKTYNALEILDREEVIRLSQRALTRIQIYFRATKSQLWEYLETFPELRSTVQNLLRTYGGIFDFPTPIRAGIICRKTGISETQFTRQLKQLENDGLIELDIRQGDLEIEFLKPREDARTIHSFSASVSSRQRIRREKVEQFSAFLSDNQQCRERQLLSYFGESPGPPCGVCDVCLQFSRKPVQGIRGAILSELRKGPKSSRELLESGLKPEHALLETLQELLDKGVLKIGAQNEYILPKT